MFIWFLHCAFFSEKLGSIIQPVMYWFKHPVLAFIWIVMVLYLLAWIWERAYRRLLDALKL
jgi:hypothetical protein